jgi:hypothetical protein
MLRLMSPSNVNLFIISYSVSPMYLILYSPYFKPYLPTIPTPVLGLVNRKIGPF